MTSVFGAPVVIYMMKLSDYLLCVKGETIAAFGTPEKIMEEGRIEALYHMEKGSYNLLYGSVELAKPTGAPRVFVVAGGGYGIPWFRRLQKRQIPFATGILFDNDVDYQAAVALSDHVVSAPGFEEMTNEQYEQAATLLEQCEGVVDAGTPMGTRNMLCRNLLELAKEKDIPIYRRNAEMQG